MTSAIIGILNEDGTIDATNVYHDGGPWGLGGFLFEYYKDENRTREMIAKGDFIEIEKDLDKICQTEGCESDEKHCKFSNIGNFIERKHIGYVEGDYRSYGGAFDYLFKLGKWYIVIDENNFIEIDDGFTPKEHHNPSKGELLYQLVDQQVYRGVDEIIYFHCGCNSHKPIKVGYTITELKFVSEKVGEDEYKRICLAFGCEYANVSNVDAQVVEAFYGKNKHS